MDVGFHRAILKGNIKLKLKSELAHQGQMQTFPVKDSAADHERANFIIFRECIVREVTTLHGQKFVEA